MEDERSRRSTAPGPRKGMEPTRKANRGWHRTEAPIRVAGAFARRSTRTDDPGRAARPANCPEGKADAKLRIAGFA